MALLLDNQTDNTDGESGIASFTGPALVTIAGLLRSARVILKIRHTAGESDQFVPFKTYQYVGADVINIPDGISYDVLASLVNTEIGVNVTVEVAQAS